MKKEVCICGNFFRRDMVPNEGQSIKTMCIYEALTAIYGKDNVWAINTYGGVKSLPKVVYGLIKALVTTKNLVVLPAGKALKLTPLIAIGNRLFHRGIHYVVIGGWLDSFVAEHAIICSFLKRYTGVYVETKTMKDQLESRGFINVCVLPNFRVIHSLTPTQINYEYKKPLRLCIFSRVMKEKGIEDAVISIKRINDRLREKAYILDIYGVVEKGEEKWFEQLQTQFTDEINYKGFINHNNSYRILSNYFAMLFPTHFYTEGIPGTIIDAFEAGLPVIYSKWEHSNDIMNDGNGFGYEFANENALEHTLLDILDNPQCVLQKKRACLNDAKNYDKDNSIRILTDRFV